VPKPNTALTRVSSNPLLRGVLLLMGAVDGMGFFPREEGVPVFFRKKAGGRPENSRLRRRWHAFRLLDLGAIRGAVHPRSVAGGTGENLQVL
jgi:hypothetical protein